MQVLQRAVAEAVVGDAVEIDDAVYADAVGEGGGEVAGYGLESGDGGEVGVVEAGRVD